jgi:hypothetical protein
MMKRLSYLWIVRLKKHFAKEKANPRSVALVRERATTAAHGAQSPAAHDSRP